MLRKINLIGLSIMFVLLLAGNAMAFCVFTVDGVKLICRTCSCAELKDAGVNVGNCVDVLSLTAQPKPYDKLLRYSDVFVTLVLPNGEEFPLASDDSQKHFDEIRAQPDFRERWPNFKAVPGVISVERVTQLAGDLRVPVVPVALTRLSRPSTASAALGRLVIIWGHGHWCFGRGFCRIIKCDTGPHCSGIVARFADVPAERKLQAGAQFAKDRLIVELTSSPPDRPSQITISENVALDTTGLPYESMTIIRGNYPVSYAENQFGTAILKVETVPRGERPTPRGEPRFEIIPQFSFLSLNRPTPIVGHGDSQGIIVGHADNGGFIVGHSDAAGIISGHSDQSGIVTGHTDQTGIGVRFTYNATPNVALETAANFFPKRNPDLFVPGGRVFQMQFGVKVGKRFERFGIFGKAAPGLIHFSEVNRLVGTQTIFVNPAVPQVVIGMLNSESKTYFSTDVGGVMEYYPSRRILIRFDLGDTLIRYGSRAAFSPSSTIIQLPAETKHNFQFSAGIGFRF